jgi:hypothetical protein
VALVRCDVLEELSASVVPSSPILVTLMKEALRSPKRRLLREPHGVTSQKTPFFTVNAVKTSNLTENENHWDRKNPQICVWRRLQKATPASDVHRSAHPPTHTYIHTLTHTYIHIRTHAYIHPPTHTYKRTVPSERPPPVSGI